MDVPGGAFLAQAREKPSGLPSQSLIRTALLLAGAPLATYRAFFFGP
jgi:hypothetical protein